MTGFPGFLGSALLPRLLARREGADAVCVVQRHHLPTAVARVATLEARHPHVRGRIRLVEGDITVADLGVEPSHSDCGDCPRRFTISRDGATLAWLDGSDLIVVPTAGGDTRLVYHLVGTTDMVADLALGDGFVVLTYDDFGQASVPRPMVVLYAADQAVSLDGRTATIAG